LILKNHNKWVLSYPNIKIVKTKYEMNMKSNRANCKGWKKKKLTYYSYKLRYWRYR